MIKIAVPEFSDNTKYWLVRIVPILCVILVFLMLRSCFTNDGSSVVEQSIASQSVASSGETLASTNTTNFGRVILSILGYILTIISAGTVLLSVLKIFPARGSQLAIASLGFLMGIVLIENQPWTLSIGMAIIVLGIIYLEKTKNLKN